MDFAKPHLVFGGGRLTVAICVMEIQYNVLPRTDPRSVHKNSQSIAFLPFCSING